MDDVKIRYFIGTCTYFLLLLNVFALSKAELVSNKLNQTTTTFSPSPDNNVNSSKKSQDNSETKTAERVLGSKNAAAIAQQNCEKYAEYRYVKKWNPEMADRKGFWYNTTDCVNVETLITEGTKAKPKEYPHMALIGYGKNFENVTWACGGSLISEKFILTAALCGSSTLLGPPQWILLGDLDISSTNDEANPAIYGVANIHDHPNFKRTSLYNDIALIELNTTVVISPYVRPACLHTSTNISTNTTASITGWGRPGIAERQSSHLLKTTIPILDDEPCKRAYTNSSSNIFKNGFDTSTMICAGDLVEGKDTCQGDSGGPLQIPLSKQVCMWSVLGVTSFGPAICGNLEDPSVYTKVSSYLDWIQSIVWP